MFSRPDRLSRKILGMLVGFLVVGCLAIFLTLMISWQLEGVAAAINDAGSQRMRSYRMGYLMAGSLNDPAGTTGQLTQLGKESLLFERVLHDLEVGDPKRPLAAPRGEPVQIRLREVRAQWNTVVRPLVDAFIGAPPAARADLLARYDAQVIGFVEQINAMVLAMERHYAADTNLLRTLQAVLLGLAIAGTIGLIRFFMVLVIHPVGVLHAGMLKMAEKDFSVRLPVASDDELGNLADGFNRMAGHLQEAYATLEERVEAETRSLAERNRELGILYGMTSFLSEPAPVEVLCQGFVSRLKVALGADAGSVRLYAPQSNTLFMIAHDGLSDDFLNRESSLDCGACLCGEVAQSGEPLQFDTARPPAGMRLGNCIREGFATATAFNIRYDKKRLGVFNVYFRARHDMSEREVHLLETLGQHLGVAIETQRLRQRERELAVSEERNLLAQELHDSIAQGLAFLNIQVQLLEEALKVRDIDDAMATTGQLREGVQESYDHVRELLVHFRTRLDQTDLDAAIDSALEKFEGQTGIRTALEKSGAGTLLEPGVEIQIMHIVQEALSNIRKHALASHVQVSLRREMEGVELQVRDDGQGFDPDNEPKVRSDRHVGLKIMRERAHRIGGECQIESRPGAGTCVTVALRRTEKEEA